MIRVFDVETTGLDPKVDRIVEIAAYDLTDSGDIELAGCSLVDPGRDIPPEASAVHHIVAEDLISMAKFGDAWTALNAYKPDPPITMYAAHNCAFEQGFLPTPAGVEWICTYKTALRIWPDAASHSNQYLRYWLGLDSRPSFNRSLAASAHRAAPDAYVTAFLLKELLEYTAVEQLIEWTKEPKLYPSITFGKHKGEKWANVPGDYLVWLRDGQHSMEQDWRHGAKVELLRRGSRA